MKPPFFDSVRPLITFPSADKLLLIILASSKVWPWASVLPIFSEPAKSQQYILPIFEVSVLVFFYITVTRKIEWDRLEVAFILVAATDLLAYPLRITSNISYGLDT